MDEDILTNHKRILRKCLTKRLVLFIPLTLANLDSLVTIEKLEFFIVTLVSKVNNIMGAHHTKK